MSVRRCERLEHVNLLPTVAAAGGDRRSSLGLSEQADLDQAWRVEPFSSC